MLVRRANKLLKNAINYIVYLIWLHKNGLSLDAKVDLGFARETLGPDYLLMGNVEPTNPLTLGTPGTVYEHSQKAITQAGREGSFFLSSGCIISDEAPLKNMEAMLRAGHEAIY